jgi:hypothetical protein
LLSRRQKQCAAACWERAAVLLGLANHQHHLTIAKLHHLPLLLQLLQCLLLLLLLLLLGLHYQLQHHSFPLLVLLLC